jgi:hypothetical protein
MEQNNELNKSSRLDRMEAVLQEIANMRRLSEDDFAFLLRARELLTDQVKDSSQVDERFRALADSERRMEAALKALMVTVQTVLRPSRGRAT